jgi:outer membrane protein TolC
MIFKKLRRGLAGVTLFGAIVLPTTATAEGFTLEQAVQYALEHNPGLPASRQQIDTAAAAKRLAGLGDQPTLALRYSGAFADDPLDSFAAKLKTRSVTAEDFAPDRLNDPATSSLFAGSLVFNYPLYSGGRTGLEVERFAHLEGAAGHAHERQRQQVVSDTVRAYRAVQAAGAGVAIARDARAAAEEHVKTTRKLVREERTVASDQLTAEVNLAAYRALVEQAEGRMRQSLNALELAMGLPSGAAPQTVPLPPVSDALAPEDAARHEQRALDARLDLKALREQLASAEKAVAAARTGSRPRVDLVADTSLYEDDPLVNEFSWKVMGVVSWDLYNGDRVGSEVAVARSRADEIRQQIPALEARIRGEVRDAHATATEALARIRAAQGSVAVARRNVALVKERYGQGRTILIDLLGAERGLVESRNEELAAQHAWLAARARLASADGSLSVAALP